LRAWQRHYYFCRLGISPPRGENMDMEERGKVLKELRDLRRRVERLRGELPDNFRVTGVINSIIAGIGALELEVKREEERA